MKKEDIKKHLSIYSIYNKRRTTINHAFASSIAPSDSYDDIKVSEAISYLGQSANSVLKCVYCEDEAQTWDHVVGLVKNNELRGYGHQIHEHNKIRKNKENLINLLSSYQETYSTKLNFEKLKASQEYEDFLIIKDKIFELMKEADLIAEKIRKNILI